MIEIYNHNNGNSKNNFQYLKFISFFINDKLSYFKQFTKVVMIIQNVYNNIEIDNILK